MSEDTPFRAVSFLMALAAVLGTVALVFVTIFGLAWAGLAVMGLG